MNLYQLSSPATFYPFAGKLAPWFAVAAALLTVAGLWIGFGIAPTDFQQGEAYRIIFIHVATAWMSMFIYLVMGFWSILALTFNTRLSAMMAQSLVPTGALMTFIALWTGALWGRPTWGTYWAWDARMTSELILLFLYFGVMALRNAIDDARRVRGADDRRHRQHPDHLFLGAMVEHAAPGRVGQHDRSAEDGDDHAARHGGHGLCRVVLHDCRLAVARTGDHPRARTRRRLGGGTARAHRSIAMMNFLAMGGYGFFVWGAYGMTALVIAAEIVSLRARRRAAARLAAATPQSENSP
jgi:heme exporter protein CcmD